MHKNANLILLAGLFAGVAAAQEPQPQVPATGPAAVCELVFPGLVKDGETVTVTVTAYHRPDGFLGYGKDGFYLAYAVIGGDNRSHQVDTAPTAPFGFFYEDGKELSAEDYKTITGSYAYKDPAWAKYNRLWQEGKRIAKRTAEVPPLR